MNKPREKPAFKQIPDTPPIAAAESVPEAEQVAPTTQKLAVVSAAAQVAAPASSPATNSETARMTELLMIERLAQRLAHDDTGRKRGVVTAKLTVEISADLYKRIEKVAFANDSKMVWDIEHHLRPIYFPEEFGGKA